MPDPAEVFGHIDLWCQWEETFGEDAEGLRQFFQAHPDRLEAVFTHFLRVDARHTRPTDSWWQRWMDLRATLPDALVRSLLLGLARRGEWYRGLSSPPAQSLADPEGLLRETAADEAGHFTFELFRDADGGLRVGRASAVQPHLGSEHTWSHPSQRRPSYYAYGQDTKTYAWNTRVRLLEDWVSLDAPDTLMHPHAYWVNGSPSHQRANPPPYRYPGLWTDRQIPCRAVFFKSGDRWYSRLPENGEAEMTHVISHAACWALCEFKDQAVLACLTEVALAYARKKPGWTSAAFPGGFRTSGALPEGRAAQVFGLYMGACAAQNQLSAFEEQSEHVTYQRAHSALWALERLGDDAASRCLNQILDRALDKKLQKQLRAILDVLASKRGLSRDDLADQVVPTHDLDAHGKRVWHLGDYQVSLSLIPTGHLQHTISGATGQACKNLPAKVRQEHQAVWQAIRVEEKALAATLAQQKNRLEAAMVHARRWPYARWQHLFAAHPILGHLARRLIWTIAAPDGTHLACAILEQDGTWHDAKGDLVEIAEQSLLRLTHPVELPPQDHRAWQQVIISRRLVQPFRQLFREIYVPTPAEEETGNHSNRFGGQRVLLQSFNGVARGRGWTGTMGHNSEGRGVGWRDFPEQQVRACFWNDVEGTTTPDFRLIGVIEEAAFYPAGHAVSGHETSYEHAVPLREVPALVFSEAMRDLDLFVTVSTLGVDPQWHEPGQVRQRLRQEREQERQRQEVLSREQAKVRAELLDALLPVLGVTDRVRIEEGAALVSGSRADYRIHLGSGNIYLLPTGSYLCIVPRIPEELYLPFEEEDAKTAEIMSKILLLVQDEQITDHTILRQIPSRKETL